jgi:type I restriction enzyme, S subunit
MLLSNLNLLATAPGGVARLRELILTLAVQGKLVPQDLKDEPASELLKKIRVEKDRLIAEGKIKRDKPLAEIAEEEKPFVLPKGWEWVRLGDIGDTNIGLTYSPNNVSDTGTPVLRSNNVQLGKLDLSDLKRVNMKIKDSVLVAEGDLLICARNGSKALVGKTAMICGLSEPMAFGAFMAIFRSEVNAYILHFINAPLFRRMISDVNTTTINQITQENLRSTVFPLPPLAEQSRIVTRVEELMRLCDALETKGQLEATQHAQLVSTLLGTLTQSETPEQLAENWQRIATHFDLLLDRPQAVDALEQTILQLAVRGLLVPQDPQDEPASELLKKIRAEKDKLITEGKIKRDKPLPPIQDSEESPMVPLGWEVARFGDYFFELCTGPFGSVIHKEDYVDGGVPLINPSHMIGGRISHDPSVSVALAMAGQLGAYRLTKGDVVLARRGEVGRYALVTDDEDGWLCGTGSFFVKLHEVCNREFLGLILEDPDLRLHLLGESVGSTMTNLNQRILIETLIALPPLAEQSRIVTRVAQCAACALSCASA